MHEDICGLASKLMCNLKLDKKLRELISFRWLLTNQDQSELL